MELLFIIITILIGFGTILSTIGHILLIIFVALPITRVLVMFGLLKPFGVPWIPKKDIVFDEYFLYPIKKFSLIFILITILFFFFINNYFQYLVLGYFVGGLLIMFNWIVRKTYSVSKDSFENWYLNDHRQHIDFDHFDNMNLKSCDNLFRIIETWITPEAQRDIKGLFNREKD